MAVDTVASTTVRRPRGDVAAFLPDPGNDGRWIGGIREARLLDPPPVAVGSRVERVAVFLGKRVEYVNEIVELTGERLAMRSVRAPFPMRVTDGFTEAGPGVTEVSVRVQGDAGGFYRLAAPVLSALVGRSVRRDLRTLRGVLERR